MRSGPFRTESDERDKQSRPVHKVPTTNRTPPQPNDVFDGVCMGGPFPGEGKAEDTDTTKPPTKQPGQ